MNPSRYSVNAWEEWDDFSWLLDEQNLHGSYQAQSLFQQQDVNGSHAGHGFLADWAGNSSGGSSKLKIQCPPQHHQTYQEPAWTLPSPPCLQTSMNTAWWADVFDRVPPCLDPPDTRSLQKQAPRFEGDLYTAPYIKGEGVERAGWCGFCSSWHKLKDSAYWYHMHYTHGVSCLTGRQLTGPQTMQWNAQFNGWQALCARCNAWLTLGKGDKAAKTAYYRHAYQCQVRTIPQSEKAGGVRKSRSARRLVRNDSGNFRGGHSYP